MEVDPAFKKLVRQLSISEIPQPFDEEGWIRGVADELDPSFRQRASEFVVRVLDAEMSASELGAVLDAAGSEYDINEEGIHEFFKILKKVL